MAAGTASLMAVSGMAFAADLKADLSLTTNGIQQNKDLGNVVGGSTITFTDNLFLNGGPASLTSATFDDDGNLPSWVTGVTGGTATKTEGDAASTITVKVPCTIGAFGGQGTTKAAGASVQYAVTAVNSGAQLSDVGTSSAWVNIQGNVTSLGANCNTPPADTTDPSNGSVTIDDGAVWTRNSTGGVTVDLSAADNVGIVKYRLAETQAGLATATDVPVTSATSFTASDVPFTLTGAEGADKQVWARFYDAAGRSTDASDSIGWDKSNPTTALVSINDDAAWTRSGTGGVTVDLSAVDNLGIVKYRLAETQAGLDTASDAPVSSATSFSADDVAFSLTGAEDANKQVWARLYDAAGNSVDASDGIGWDKSGPVITDDSATTAPTGTTGSGDWYTSNVTVTFRASDNLSGFAGEANPYTFTRTTSEEGAAVTVGSGTVNDVAGNTSNSVTSSPFQIDLYDPTVNCRTVPTFVLGSTGNVVADVTDTETGSGPASATASAAADTTSVGAKTVTITGLDNAGRDGEASCGYNVVYDWTGFFRPVDNLPTLNSVKAGSSVPVKFNLGGNQGLDIMQAGYPRSQVITCGSTTEVDGIEETVTAGQSSLSYDATAGHYTYVWKTEKAWAGTCRQLVVTLKDGTVHRANFKLMK